MKYLVCVCDVRNHLGLNIIPIDSQMSFSLSGDTDPGSIKNAANRSRCSGVIVFNARTNILTIDAGILGNVSLSTSTTLKLVFFDEYIRDYEYRNDAYHRCK